jgi:hypothetical protein
VHQASEAPDSNPARRGEDHLRYWLITLGVALALGALFTAVAFVFDRSGIGFVAFLVVPIAGARIVAQRRRLASNARNPGNWDGRMPQDDARRLWPGAWKRSMWAYLMVLEVEVKDGVLQITPVAGYTQVKIPLAEITLDTVSTAFFVSVYGRPVPMFTRVYIFRLTTNDHGPLRLVLDERDTFETALSAALPAH